MTKMRDKRLNSADRDLLLAFAQKHITCPHEQEAYEAAYTAARVVVLAAVHAKFPVKDMKVLERYGASHHDSCVRFGGAYDTDATFYFKRDDAKIPLVPRYSGCSTRAYDWSDEARKVTATYQLAAQALKKARDAKVNDYRRLILGARSFNEIVSVWPAAETLRSKIIPDTVEQRALAVLSQDVIEKIKADNAGAELAKAA